MVATSNEPESGAKPADPYKNEDWWPNQLDLRVSRTFRRGPKTRLQANADIYNALNDGSLLSPNPVYGPQWRLPATASSVTTAGSGVLVGRLVQFSGQLSF